MAEAIERRVAGGRGSATAGNGNGRKPQNAGGVAVEFEAVELHSGGGWGVPDLQHDFCFGGAAAQRNRNCAGARRGPKGSAGRVSGRSSLPGTSGCIGRVAAGPPYGGRSGEADGCDGGIAVCQQPAWGDCTDARLSGAGVADWSGSRSGVRAFASARSNASFSCGCDGTGKAGISCALT